jgi:osmoprotectant transport system substrate-binding protein
MTRPASAARRALLVTCVVALAGVAAGCSSKSQAIGPTRSWDPSVVRIGSFDFTESALLATLYGKALEAAGVPVTYSLNLGSREIAEPALEQGFVDLLPEYLGSALQFASLGKNAATGSEDAAFTALQEQLRLRGLAALRPSPAQDQNAVVVRATTAAALHLLTVSDLVPHSRRITFGAPAECLVRDLCLPGLERAYGLRFRSVIPMDASGDYIVSSLAGGTIQAGLLFSTDGRLPARGLRALIDDRGLQPLENVTPLVRRVVMQHLGARLAPVVNAVSGKLTTTELTQLNEQVTVRGLPISAVAERWLQEQGLGS